MAKWPRELRPTNGVTTMANRKKDARRHVPTVQEVMDLPPAAGGIFFMTEKEIKTLRSRIYTLNRDNAFRWRWRTLVDGQQGRYSQLLVWRIH